MPELKAYDYEPAKKEYITENKNISKLSKKYNIPYSTLYKYAMEHGWKQARKEYWEKKDEKMMEQGLVSTDEISARIRAIAAMLINKAYIAVEGIEPGKLLVSDSRLFKNITGSLKDIKEICDIKNELDKKEQIIRIEGLEKKIQAINDDAEGVEIIMDEQISELGG